MGSCGAGIPVSWLIICIIAVKRASVCWLAMAIAKETFRPMDACKPATAADWLRRTSSNPVSTLSACALSAVTRLVRLVALRVSRSFSLLVRVANSILTGEPWLAAAAYVGVPPACVPDALAGVLGVDPDAPAFPRFVWAFESHLSSVAMPVRWFESSRIVELLQWHALVWCVGSPQR